MLAVYDTAQVEPIVAVEYLEGLHPAPSFLPADLHKWTILGLENLTAQGSQGVKLKGVSAACDLSVYVYLDGLT